MCAHGVNRRVARGLPRAAEAPPLGNDSTQICLMEDLGGR